MRIADVRKTSITIHQGPLGEQGTKGIRYSLKSCYFRALAPGYKFPNVTAPCPDCGGALSTFENRDGTRELGYVLVDKGHSFNGAAYSRTCYVLLRCASCYRGGMAKIHDNGSM